MTNVDQFQEFWADPRYVLVSQNGVTVIGNLQSGGVVLLELEHPELELLIATMRRMGVRELSAEEFQSAGTNRLD